MKKPRFLAILKEASLLQTLYVNLRLFPLRTALKLPVLCGPRCDIGGLRRGAVVLTDPPRPGLVVWGITPSPRFSVKGMWTFIRFSRKGCLTCGAGFIVRGGASLVVAGKMTCGRDVLINQRAMVSCQKQIDIGDHVRVGWDVQMLDSDCHLVYNENKRRISVPYRPIRIGRNVWLASRVNVGKGAVVPDYSIVGRGAFINKDFSDVTTRGNLFVGVPAALRATGFYRLLDIPLERRVSKDLKNTAVTSFDVDDYHVDIEAALNPPPHPGF